MSIWRLKSIDQTISNKVYVFDLYSAKKNQQKQIPDEDSKNSQFTTTKIIKCCISGYLPIKNRRNENNEEFEQISFGCIQCVLIIKETGGYRIRNKIHGLQSSKKKKTSFAFCSLSTGRQFSAN